MRWDELFWKSSRSGSGRLYPRTALRVQKQSVTNVVEPRLTMQPRRLFLRGSLVVLSTFFPNYDSIL